MVDRKLGRGLDFFLSGGRSATPASHTASSEETLQVEVGMLAPNPHQPRGEMRPQELAELAASIKSNGILQPILARRVGDRYEIVAGERRWRAAKEAGLERVPVLVKPITDEESAVFALVENLQRSDLNAIEKARAFQALQARFQASQEVVAKRVGLDRSTVANFLRLLDLPEEVQAHVSRGTLSMGHARALLGIQDPEVRIQLADDCIRQQLSVRALEERVRELASGPAAPADGEQAIEGKASAAPRSRPVWLNELEETLVEALGTTVAIRYGRKKSQILIECVGREEFERIYARLKNC